MVDSSTDWIVYSLNVRASESDEGIVYFVGDPFIHPIFRPKQRKANATYLGVCARFTTFRNITKLRACY